MKNAVVLCSGGLDSVVTAYYVKKKLKYKNLIILFFNYGQKSYNAERKCSRETAKSLGAEFEEIKIKELGKLSFSLINKTGKIKKLNRTDLSNTKKESEKWYVPCRNLVFLSYALALCETKKIKKVFVGFKNEGRESFPDATPEFVNLVNKISLKSSISRARVLAPLIKKDKEDIILLGNKLGVDFRKTFSCYVSGEDHCGVCLACKLRQEGFYWANMKDPMDYLEN